MSGTEIVAIAVVGVMALGFIVFVVAVCLDARTTGPRTCNACGHERGWHTTWRPAGYPWGCKHPPDRPGQTGLWCSCPAGRRSIR